MTITLYHNPHCSKSREALTLTQNFADRNDIALNVVDYQKTPPTLAQLTALHGLLGSQAGSMVRENEEEYELLNLSKADDQGLLQALAAYPKLLQRPIVVYGQQAAIGRPIERIEALLQAIRN